MGGFVCCYAMNWYSGNKIGGANYSKRAKQKSIEHRMGHGKQLLRVLKSSHFKRNSSVELHARSCSHRLTAVTYTHLAQYAHGTWHPSFGLPIVKPVSALVSSPWQLLAKAPQPDAIQPTTLGCMCYRYTRAAAPPATQGYNPKFTLELLTVHIGLQFPIGALLFARRGCSLLRRLLATLL